MQETQAESKSCKPLSLPLNIQVQMALLPPHHTASAGLQRTSGVLCTPLFSAEFSSLCSDKLGGMIPPTAYRPHFRPLLQVLLSTPWRKSLERRRCSSCSITPACGVGSPWMLAFIGGPKTVESGTHLPYHRPLPSSMVSEMSL